MIVIINRKADGWDFKFKKPFMSAVGERLDIPPIMEAFILSPRPYEATMYDRYFLGYDRPICYATETKVNNILILADQTLIYSR